MNTRVAFSEICLKAKLDVQKLIDEFKQQWEGIVESSPAQEMPVQEPTDAEVEKMLAEIQ